MLVADVEFAIGAKRIALLWWLLDSIVEGDWTDALDRDGAQVAVVACCLDWWPAMTRLLVCRVWLVSAQISADPRAWRRRILHPDQCVLSIAELAGADVVYGYSFILTNLDVSTPAKAAAVEYWYRHRTAIEKDARR